MIDCAYLRVCEVINKIVKKFIRIAVFTIVDMGDIINISNVWYKSFYQHIHLSCEVRRNRNFCVFYIYKTEIPPVKAGKIYNLSYLLTVREKDTPFL